MKLRHTLLDAIGLAFAATAAQAEIQVGVVLSATGSMNTDTDASPSLKTMCTA